jgi:hypothetical protein
MSGSLRTSVSSVKEEYAVEVYKPSSDATHPSAQTSQDIVASCVNAARDRGVEPTTRVIGHLAKNIKDLFDEGKTPDEILAGFTLMLERQKVQPSLLGNFVMEAALPKKQPARYGRGLTTAQILGRTA